MSFFSATYFGKQGANIVDVTGGISESIKIGDDYTADSDRQFAFTISLISGLSVSSTCRFTGRHRYRCDQSWSVAGTITIAGSQAVLTFDLASADTAALVAGDYLYSVHVVTDDGDLVTVVSESPVELVYGPGATNSCQC